MKPFQIAHDSIAYFFTYGQVLYQLLLQAVLLRWHPGFVVPLDEEIDYPVPVREEGVHKQIHFKKKKHIKKILKILFLCELSVCL